MSKGSLDKISNYLGHIALSLKKFEDAAICCDSQPHRLYSDDILRDISIGLGSLSQTMYERLPEPEFYQMFENRSKKSN
jgi:hypothetical protein